MVVCHNCRQKIAICDEPRITTTGIMKGAAHGSYLSISMSFHAEPKCLSNWDYYQNAGAKTKRILPFNKKVALSPGLNIDPKYQKQLDKLAENGIAIVPQTPFVIYNHIPGERT